MKRHAYQVRIDRTGNGGEGTKTYKRLTKDLQGYRRDCTLASEGKPQIQGSSDGSHSP
jgi:hypothetical protein